MKRGVSQQERQMIVNLHNALRAHLASGQESHGVRGGQPPAADMLEVRNFLCFQYTENLGEYAGKESKVSESCYEG